MKIMICAICLVSLVAGCSVNCTVRDPVTHQVVKRYVYFDIGPLPFLVPGIILIERNIKEVDAMVEAEKKAIVEDAQQKNPIYYVEGVSP